MIINISDFYLNQVKSALAYPVVPNVQLSDDDIKTYAVWEAMYRYFTKFPIRVNQQINQTSTQMEIPFPDDETIGVLDLRTVDKTNYGNSGSNNDFWQLVRHNNFYNTRTSTFSRYKLNPEGLKHVKVMEETLMDSYINNQDTFRHEVDYTNKVVRVFSTLNAELLIVWGKTSNNFDAINYTYIPDVLSLAKAYLKRHLASLGNMLIDNGAEKQINVDSLKDEANEIEEKILEKWNEFPDVINLRMQ